MEFIQLKYGKYLNRIDNEIPPEHIMLENAGEISRSMEPGEVNLPSGENYSISLANLDPEGNQRYPFSWWQEQARQPGEGASQLLQIYFQIFVNGEPQFTGILKRVRFTTYDAECILELADMTEMLRIEERQMLKAFEFTIPRPLMRTNDENEGITIDAPGQGHNDLPQMIDLDGNTLPHQTMTFQLFVSGWTGTQSDGKLNTLNRDGSNRYPFAWHLGWQDVDYVTPVGSNDGLVLREQVGPRYIQIGDITLFTRCRIQLIQVRNDAGSRSRQEVWCTIWHSAVEPSGGVIPRGRFLWDDQLITEETEEMEVIFHEANYGFDEDVAMYAGTLPLDRNFIFGLPYTTSGANIVLTSASYAYFDVLQKTTEIINTDVSARHTDDGLTGSIQITAFAPQLDSGDNAMGVLGIEQGPISEETLFVRLKKGSEVYDSSTFIITPNDSLQVAIDKARTAINTGQTGTAWNAAPPSNGNITGPFEVHIHALQSGEDWNGYDVQVFEIVNNNIGFPQSVWSSLVTSGGTDGGFESEPIDFLIGGQVFATTAAITDTDTLASIAEKVRDAAVAVGDSDYEFTLDGATVNVVSFKSDIQGLSLDVGATNVQWASEPLTGSFELFDISRLRPEYRLAFYSDVIMFGWQEKSVIETLVAAAWQVSAQLFTNAAGKIAIQSRNWFEFYPNDINSPDFDAHFIEDEDWEPAAGNEYDEGFQSYETTHPVDIVEINNLRSSTDRTIYSDKDGERDGPTLKNKPIQTGNYRTFDLSVEQGSALYRYSPDDGAWPGPPLSEFLPTPRIQLNLIARTYFFPTSATRLRVYWPDMMGVDVGQYVWGQDANLWLVKEFRLNPRTMTADLRIEFKKTLVDFYVENVELVGVGEIFEFGQVVEQEFIEAVPVAEASMDMAMSVADEIAVEEASETKVSEQYLEGIESGEHFSDQVEEPES